MSSLREERLTRVRNLSLRREEHRLRSGEASLNVHRAISLVATLGLFWPLLKAWENIVAVPVMGIALVALSAGALWLAIVIATAQDQDRLDRLDRWLLALALLVLIGSAAITLHGQSGYGTDEAALEQGAATLLLHGHDPYGANLTSALAGFSTPLKYQTYTMSGGMVTTFGYPAFPLLLVAPFVALTMGGQAVPMANVLVLLLITIAMFRVLPREWRGVAVVACVGLPVLSSFALSGLNVIIAVAGLLLAATRWTSTGRAGTLERGDQLKAVAFGLALATNPIAWFIGPFLVSGIYLVRRADLGPERALRVVVAYSGLAAATFAAINLPFFLWGPSAWLHGVAAPLTQHAIPYGQGIIDLTLFMRLGGGALDAYNYAAAGLYLALLLVYLARFRTLARACFLLPLATLFVSGRSLADYWMVPIAVIVVGALSAEARPIAGAAQLALPARWRIPAKVGQTAMVALFLPFVWWLGVALTTPQPLTMRILRAHSGKSVRGVDELRVLVGNRSAQPLRPHFAINATGQAVLWDIARGPRTLAPGSRAVYRLTAPGPAAMPHNDAPFMLEAVTASPRTISSSAQFTQSGPAPGYW